MPFSTDTRTLQPGDTYVAIRGEVHDGHRFIPQALEAGATGIVTEQAVDVPQGIEVTRVDDSIDWLVENASAKVKHSGAKVVAITGSVGKTTTRAAIHAVVAESFPVVASEGNKNTPLGLALMLLNRTIPSGAVLVLEMGARSKGDIRELCAAFPPDVSVLTNVKGVHVETMGSIEGVAREKSEIIRALGPTGVACLNGDDERVRTMTHLHGGLSLLFGTHPTCDLRPNLVTATLPILGDHAMHTALAAFAVGRALGMDDAAINNGLATMMPEKGRLVRLRGANESTLIDDTYNASPDAAIAAVRVLRQREGSRRIACLGDMLELGETEVEQHANVLRDALEHADVVFAVGPIMAKAADGLAVETVASSTDLAERIRAGEAGFPQAGDVVLVKGSQGTRMERVSEALLHPDLDPADVLPRQSTSWRQIA
ncbi:MAG: UDP-N-acetylmuramoyl-tripeptide--D-alanyl-D-alanine ligase [Rubricoccaceae bacterium]